MCKKILIRFHSILKYCFFFLEIVPDVLLNKVVDVDSLSFSVLFIKMLLFSSTTFNFWSKSAKSVARWYLVYFILIRE